MSKKFAAILLTFLSLTPTALFAQYKDAAPQPLASIPDLQADYRGYIGERIDAVVDNWETRVLKANPAILSVLQLRERTPKSSSYYVPWVGEFIGKYLENAILLTQASRDPELQATVQAAISALVASQDRDGYLGPYSKDERLVVCWDLWGHYHAMTALMLYYERYHDANALEAARRAGMFVEKIFYHKDKDGAELGVKDVGSDEVNFSIVTALCQLYRLTDEEHFLDCAKRVLKDLESKGDFYREGLAGSDFYRTPQPRWESLHTILGLSEFYRIEGDETYKRAFLNLWESVLKRDVHNNGSFSCGESAIGTPFRKGAIETCCSVAWIVLTLEALRNAADPKCADALENSLYNAVCAYTHPSGSWCAYDTPMNGRREASQQTIVFQARPGQPELNCCSVNSPRGFAELVEWGVMLGKDEDGKTAVYVNYYGEGTSAFRLGKKQIAVTQKTNYPVDGKIELAVETKDEEETELTLKLRVPEWAQGAKLVTPENADGIELTPGEYASVKRTWKKGETIALDLPFSLRYVSGDGDFADRISVYYGPLLLAYDQFFNRFEEDAIPTISPNCLESAEIELLAANPNAARVGFYSPQIFVKLTPEGENAQPLFLVDFAFAGSLGTTYASWLPAQNAAPPTPACELPKQDAKVPTGAMLFTWRKMAGAKEMQIKAVVSDSPNFSSTIFEAASTNGKDAVATPEQTKALDPGKTYYWKVVATNEFGSTESLAPGRRFSVDETLPEFDYDAYLAKRSANKALRTLVADKLAIEPAPTTGVLASARNTATSDDGAVAFNGRDSIVTYELDAFPAIEYEAAIEFCLDAPPEKGRIAQIISAWSKGMDDPIRVAIDSDGRIYGAVESSRSGMTLHTELELGVWHKLRVAKEQREFTLYLDDEEIGRFVVDEEISTDSKTIALGGNPLFTGEPEFFNGKLRNFELRGICEK